VKGTYYSVGAGPGDPQLLTLKAIEILRDCPVVALPDSGAGNRAVRAIVEPYLEGREVVECSMPMTRDTEVLKTAHREAAEKLAGYLDRGLSVAFPTLGDPSVYSTAAYVQQELEAMGYRTAMVPGVPSFCAAAAALNTTLCEGDQPLHILPAGYTGAPDDLQGNLILMKSGRRVGRVLRDLKDRDRRIMAVECCGMEEQRIHRTGDTIPEDASYFCTILVKEMEK